MPLVATCCPHQVLDLLIFQGREELETYLLMRKQRHHLVGELETQCLILMRMQRHHLVGGGCMGGGGALQGGVSWRCTSSGTTWWVAGAWGEEVPSRGE